MEFIERYRRHLEIVTSLTSDAHAEEYNRVVTQALQNDGIQVYGVFGEGKLYVFYYEK